MPSAFAWGKASLGATGLSTIEHGTVTIPHQMPLLEGADIQNLSSGHNHTLICLKNGVVYSCGANDFCQCGQEGILAKLGRVKSLDVQHALQVAVGSSHSVVLTEAHEVFTWGRNDSGQLGRGDVPTKNRGIPKLVKSLAVHCVIQVSCGCDHTITLTNEGLVFVWGSNNYGQLGLGKSADLVQTEPGLIECIRGIPVLQVTAGGNHSILLSKSGAVYAWGRNSFGQLGLNDTQDYNMPQQCRPLRSQKIKYICCGDNHTACLTKDGRVFTYGEGTYGQLGHCGYQNEILPKQVMELSGSEVAQIACGRGHTLAYVSKSGKLYAFGLGESGQLGLSNTRNENSPSQIKGPFADEGNPCSMQVDNEGLELRIRCIYAGGDQSFIVAEDADACQPDDFRVEIPLRQILILSQSKIEPLLPLHAKDKPDTEISVDLEKIFSSASCLNGSFLLKNDEHFGSSSKKHGVDMTAVRDFFQDLGKVSNVIITQFICTNLEQYLIPKLPKSPPDVEALRLYLMLPESHIFDKVDHHISIICQFASNLLSLEPNALKVFDSWWPSNQPSFFNRLVVIYKQCLEYILQSLGTTKPQEVKNRQNDLSVSMKMLQKLNMVNEANNQIIPYHKFHVPELSEKMNIREDYVDMVLGKNIGSKVGGIRVPGLYFSNYPFILDAEAKNKLLETDAEIQMHKAAGNAHLQNLFQLFTRTDMPLQPESPCLSLVVSRSNLIEDTLRQLQKQHSANFKKKLQITFQGEEAIDAGGVRKEFFMLLLQEIMDPMYNMFRTQDKSNLQWFSMTTLEEPCMFCMIGIICGLAIYNHSIIDLHFPLALYKKLLKKPVTLDDLKELMPEIGKSLQDLIDYDWDDMEETFSLTFEVLNDQFGKMTSVELIDNGASKMVNQSNKQEYIDLYVDYILNKSIESQFKAFRNGFHMVCGGQVLEMFHPQELQAILNGNEDYDFTVFEKNTEYKRDYYRQHPTIKLFWEVFSEMSLEDKKKFLLFLTGSYRIPVSGMKDVKMIIQPFDGREDLLPVAHTCFNVLDLPRYTYKTTLKDKLQLAIQHTEGFGLA